MSYFKKLVYLNAAREWVMTREMRAKNEGRFLTEKEIKTEFSPSNTGLVINGTDLRLSQKESFRNTAIVATTGSGKTTSFIIPNILSINDASFVITDPSGALSEATGADLERRGYKVIIVDPVHLSESAGFNPVSRANSIPAIQEIAHILTNSSSDNQSDPFWSQSAKTIMGILLACLRNHPDYKTYANLSNLLYLLNNFGDGSPLIRFIAENAPNEQVVQSYKGFIRQADRTMQGILSQAKSAIAWVEDPDIARLTSSNTFKYTELRKQKTAIFLRFPQNKMGYYAPLLNLFYTQLFHFLLDDDLFNPSELSVYCLLDEFGHLTIPHFSSIITTTRARHVSITMIVQALSQLEERYGANGAKTILFGGCGSQIYFGGMDEDTANSLSGILGDMTVQTFQINGTFRKEKERLMSPHALYSMPNSEVILLHAGTRPVKIQVTPHYEQPSMLRRTKTKYQAPKTALPQVKYVPIPSV